MLALILSLGAAHGGAWTPDQGDAYGKVNLRFLAGRAAYADDGEVVETGAYRDTSLRAYYELGLSDLTTLVYSGTPIGRATYEGASAQYLGPNAVGLRRSLWDHALQVAVEGRVGWSEPFGQPDLATQSGSALTPPGYAYEPSVGNHFLDLEISLGRGIKNGWVTGTIGGRTNTADVMSNAVTGVVQAGWVFQGRFELDLHVPWYLPTGPVDQVNFAGTGETSYVGVGLGFGWWFRESLGVAVAAEGVAMAQSNAATPSLTLGLQFR